MATREIPREEWTGFFDQFSRDHQDASATVEITGAEIGDQSANAQVFRGISADTKDGENRIAIMVGPASDEGATRNVSAPTAVWLRDDAGATTLEIRADDMTVLLRLG